MRSSLLLFLFLILSCTKTTENAKFSKKMEFTTTHLALTRGIPITNSAEISEMGVFAYYTGDGIANNWSNKGSTTSPNIMNNIKHSNNEGSWSSIMSYYWPPASNANVTFYSYSPYESETNGLFVMSGNGFPIIRYTVPLVCQNQPDLLVSTPVLDKNITTNGSLPVPFEMKHALSCIGFKVKGNGENIEKIALKGVSVSGDMTISSTGEILWTNLGAPTNTEFEAGIPASLLAGNEYVNATLANGYLMMIPQTLGTDAKMIITVNGINKEINLSGSWLAGEKRTYEIIIDLAPLGPYVIINGLKWAKGNLIANGPNDCIIGEPTDNGLYFQYGSLIGWCATGAPSISVKPIEYSGPTSWQYPYVASPTIDNPAVGKGDPCRYYLGELWRLPTMQEQRSLFNNLSVTTLWPSVQNWTWQTTVVGAKYKVDNKELFLPAVGYRTYSGGILTGLGTGSYLSSTLMDATYAHCTYITKDYYYPNYVGFYRAYGFAVRCVSE